MNTKLIHDNEKAYFAISLVLSILIYIFLIFSIVGIFYIVVGVIVTFVLHGLMIGNIRNNGVKLTRDQYPGIFLKVEELSRQMGLASPPAVYVIQADGLLNAFATRFFGKNFIVLYSDIFEIHEDNEDALTFVIAHELAHIQRRHMTKQMLILPALWMPFVGKAYSRACEFTCDRIATAYVGSTKSGIKGLAILAIGKHLYDTLNINDYLLNSKNETGFFVWLSHILSTHPPLPKRMEEIIHLDSYPELYGYSSKQFEVKVG